MSHRTRARHGRLVPRTHTPVLFAVLALVVAAGISSPAGAATALTAHEVADETLTVREMPAHGLNLTGFAPGDRTQWAAEVTNSGEPGILTVHFLANEGNTMMSGGDSGMQVTVDLCPSALIPSVSAEGIQRFHCETGQTRLGTVTTAGERRLTAERTIGTGKTVGVRVHVMLPATADNSVEDAAADLDVVFSITSRDDADAASSPATPSPSGWLARTGADPAALVFAAAAIIAAGVLVQFLSRRRDRRPGGSTS
jgi:hypothetical protein